MLNALFVSLRGANPGGVARAARSMQRQGFLAAPGFNWDGGTLCAWVHPSQRDIQDFNVHTPVGTACCVGALWYEGQFGNAALRTLLNQVDVVEHLEENELRGTFALFVHTPRRCLLMNDLLGFARIYSSCDGLFYSTSWLATCAYVGNVGLDEAAATEFVLLGASHSDRTVARGVTTLPLASAFDLLRRRVQARPRVWDMDRGWTPPTLDAAVARIGAHLQKIFAEVAAAFPTRVRTALSGGFDSRLILAGLLAAGVRPELFAYGDAASRDVFIAQLVADSAGISLEVIDKRVLDLDRPPPDLARLLASALFFDGLPNDGIWDLGSDQGTRLVQTANGHLVLNGGGGEILRNYFHLPDRSLSAMDIVHAFYRGFDHRVFRSPGELSVYETRLAAAILREVAPKVENVRQRLDRGCVELAYPLFRCHHWMAVNNSVAIRHGYYVTPLIDPEVIRLAWRLPLGWKNAGDLESRLVARLHDSVARQESVYGFRFSDGPGVKARFAAWRDRMRPVFARPVIAALGRRLRKSAVSSTLLARCRALLPGEWHMDSLLDLQRLPDDQAFSRALAIEVVWRHLLP